MLKPTKYNFYDHNMYLPWKYSFKGNWVQNTKLPDQMGHGPFLEKNSWKKELNCCIVHSVKYRVNGLKETAWLHK